MISLHQITNSVLFQSGRPIHWYAQVLKYTSDCLRELQFDVIGTVRTKKLEVNSYGAVELPCDYLDAIRIGAPYSSFVSSIGTGFNANRLVNINDKGERIPYGNSWRYGDTSGEWQDLDRSNTNYGGRHTYLTIIPERKEIQLSQSYYKGANPQFLILDYITDGSEVDNACRVDPYAQACIEAYAFWKLKAHNRSVSPGEAKMAEGEYDKQMRILRGRKNAMTRESVIASMQRAYGKQV